MKASDCTLDHAQVVARDCKELAEAMSFMQVEHGYSELRACWDGFVEVSDNYEQTFPTKRKICFEFADALSEYISYLEPTPR